VRLKSGDPAVFGRLGEELDALRRAGIEFEIIPGITAASAAAAAAKITLTDRRAASALVVVTAHNIRSEKLRVGGFDAKRTTIAVYMPGPDYGRTARELMESGVDLNTPCVLISSAGRSNQEVRRLSLSQLPTVHRIDAPALLLVGEVARSTDVDAHGISRLELETATVLQQNAPGTIPQILGTNLSN
jgi:siroheme synthase